MAYCFYNGVKLPELPSDVLANYPYCWIRKNNNTGYYDAIFTKVVGYYDASAGASNGGIVYSASTDVVEVAQYRVTIASADAADNWEHFQTTNMWVGLDDNRTMMWSNHYIPNGSLTATEMYFDGSEAIPDAESYEIQKDTMVSIADQVRRLCNTEAIMTPAVIKSNLEGLNIDLMETFVISGSEEQVIYPDEGYYGFSKITVGAVDTSGGSGGDIEIGGSAEDTTFGDDYYNVPTGNYDYSAGADENPSYIPEIPGGEYQILFGKKLKAGKQFRYWWNGEWNDVQSASDIYVYGAWAYAFEETRSFTRTSVILYSGSSQAEYFTKKATETSWGSSKKTTTNSYASGYFANLAGSGASNNENLTTLLPPNEVKGIPFFSVGQCASADDTAIAVYGLVNSEEIMGADTEQFIAFGSDTQILYDGSVINNTDNSPMTIYEVDAADTNTWEEVGTTDGTDYPVGGYTLVWNSHDLKDMDGLYVTNSKSDDPIAEMSLGDTGVTVERTETYTIEGSTANSLMSAAQKVTGSKTPLTPTAAATALEEYQSQPAEVLKW